MNTTRLSKALLVAALGGVALLGCRKDEAVIPPTITEPAPPPALEIPAATVSIIDVVLGNDAAVTAPTTTFAPGDTTIYAAVATQTSDPTASVSGTLSAKWTHVDSEQTIAEDSQDFSFAGAGATTFQISNPDGWPVGNYRLDISLDGVVVNTSDFSVQ